MSDEMPPLPQRYIQAKALAQRVGAEASGLPLRDFWGRITAYAVHCCTGPYLMTVQQWDLYKHRNASKAAK